MGRTTTVLLADRLALIAGTVLELGVTAFDAHVVTVGVPARLITGVHLECAVNLEPRQSGRGDCFTPWDSDIHRWLNLVPGGGLEPARSG
jgi:hypothetical protein